MTIQMDCTIEEVDDDMVCERPSTAALRIALREARTRRERRAIWKVLCFRRAHPGLSFSGAAFGNASGTRRRPRAKRRG